MIARLDSRAADFTARLAALAPAGEADGPAVQARVGEILAAVEARGDAAVLEYTARFDDLAVDSMAALEVPAERLQVALEGLPAAQRDALAVAAARIRDYHERQLGESWQYTDELGNVLGQQVTSLGRVGVYVPGGKASYPSSVLMNALPAHVAGVEDITMVVPAPGGELSELVLAAAGLAGVSRVYTIGGAQAVAALAYGTETVAAVDKIVGPGNAYVAEAKRQVFGRVGIDMVAGPSEILIICDGGTDPAWIAMDLFSQAEHDENAQALLLSPDAAFLDAVAAAIEELLPQQERREIIAASLARRGALVLTADLDDAVRLSNRIAPEHLELSVADPEALLPSISAAGAIFMGRYSAEALGDYCAGPNHVLPTAGSARFFSPLGVYDFQKRSSIINVSRAGARVLGDVASTLARGESLTAHARSAEYRRDAAPEH
ncbi:histidinol dehydrogenase [Pseudohaliea rubra]|uniref:Histidinol dehydrogenase n=1 Tax=Pseudohaliea rubra DSM 19751 TaxID=1265313 RepID=A0A095VQ44_9GAMM|nr:Histidinol dehydrogenase [Pseudohaliea rubra DSM 19751]